MTPAEWFAAVTPEPLLVARRPDPAGQEPPSPAVARKHRLFACACARMVWDLLTTEARSAVQISERYADGKASVADLRAAAVRPNVAAVSAAQIALEAAHGACVLPQPGAPPAGWTPPNRPLLAHLYAAASAARTLATHAVGPLQPPPISTRPVHNPAWDAAFAAARATQAAYARDIFPPPDYTPHLGPEWLTSTVVALARQMDESGDFSAAPILADALQDAGCDDPAVLQCCRVPGNVHVRGNWVVDLVLGRA